jgi:exodeoxyribonuclease VII large subunit
MQERIIMQREKVDDVLRLLASFNPKAVLKRGYSILRLNGKIISSIKNIKPKDIVDTQLSDGSFGSKVLHVKK